MSQSDEINAGFDAGLRGSAFGPTTAVGMTAALNGQVAANRKSEGSIEWLVAPIVLAPIFACLYPVTTAATLTTAFAAEAMANLFGLGAHSLFRIVLILAPVIFVTWTVGRRDQQWALNRTYYRIRHVARLIIFALVANAAAMNAGGQHREWGLGDFVKEMFTMPNVAAVVLMVVFWQWLIQTGVLSREYWNKKLEMWHFRPAGYPMYNYPWQKSQIAQRSTPFVVPPGIARHLGKSRPARDDTPA